MIPKDVRELWLIVDLAATMQILKVQDVATNSCVLADIERYISRAAWQFPCETVDWADRLCIFLFRIYLCLFAFVCFWQGRASCCTMW
jgi:hypothetical protein